MAYFDGPQWNDATTAAWLAGLIERAGSVAVRPRSGVVLLTVSARDRTTVEAAHALFPVGRVAAHPKIAGIHVWSVQGHSEVRQILKALQPYFASKGHAFADALQQIDACVETGRKRQERDRRILALREAGHTQAQIAEMVAATPSTVANVIAAWRRVNGLVLKSRRKNR